MQKLSRLLAYSLTIGCMLMAAPAFSQDAPPPDAAEKFGPRAGAQPQAQTVATHGKWLVQCADQKGADGNSVKSCGMIQNAKSEKDPNVQLAVIVSKVKREADAVIQMRVIAPIGAYLPTGIPIEIDGAALQSRLVFTRCLGRICEALGEASPETLKKFLKGNDATFYLYDRPGNGYPMKISLEGFAAAIEELDKL